jgi:hypothetical protein
MSAAGDSQIVAVKVGNQGASNLSITTWSATASGIRITDDTVLIGAGGTTSLAPTSSITFNSPPGSATLTGDLAMSAGDLDINGNLTLTAANPIISSTDTGNNLRIRGGSTKGINFQVNGATALNALQLEATGEATFYKQINGLSTGSDGLLIKNLSGNTGGITIQNNDSSASSDIIINQSGTNSVITQIGGTDILTVTSAATTVSNELILDATNPTISSTNVTNNLTIEGGVGIDFKVNGATNVLQLNTSGVATFYNTIQGDAATTGAYGLYIKNQGTNASASAGILIENAYTASDLIIAQDGNAKNVIIQVDSNTQLSVSASSTTLNKDLILNGANPTISSTNATDLTIQSATGQGIDFQVNGATNALKLDSTGEATFYNKIRGLGSSSVDGLKINNQSGNIGNLEINNNNTTSDIVIAQDGNTNKVITKVNSVDQLTVETSLVTFGASTDIKLRTNGPVSNVAGYLGWTFQQNGDNTAGITTAIPFNNTIAGVILPIGVYIFNFLLFNTATGAGQIDDIQVAMSTSNAGLSGGFSTYVHGFQEYATTSSFAVVGNASYTFSVPTQQAYYYYQVMNHNFGSCIGTINSYVRFTRIA